MAMTVHCCCLGWAAPISIMTLINCYNYSDLPNLSANAWFLFLSYNFAYTPLILLILKSWMFELITLPPPIPIFNNFIFYYSTILTFTFLYFLIFIWFVYDLVLLYWSNLSPSYSDKFVNEDSGYSESNFLSSQYCMFLSSNVNSNKHFLWLFLVKSLIYKKEWTFLNEFQSMHEKYL